MKKNPSSGFTLVELAIVLVVVGLLIAGILKGQELVANTQANMSVTRARAIDTAIVSFRDTYKYLPGDLPRNPALVLPNCSSAVCIRVGNGDAQIGLEDAQVQTAAALNTENTTAFAQLSAVNLLGGIQSSFTVLEFGVSNPSAPGSGGFRLGFSRDSVILGMTAAQLRSGHYLSLVNNLTGSITGTDNDNAALTPAQAARIDKKMDDGMPNTGAVIGQGVVDVADVQACVLTTGVNSGYATEYKGTNCGVYIRILN